LTKINNTGNGNNAINFAKVSNFGKVCAVKSDTSELSEDIGEVRK